MITIKSTINLKDFKAWGPAKDKLKMIIEAGDDRIEQLESYIGDEPVDEMWLNDFISYSEAVDEILEDIHNCDYFHDYENED